MGEFENRILRTGSHSYATLNASGTSLYLVNERPLHLLPPNTISNDVTNDHLFLPELVFPIFCL